MIQKFINFKRTINIMMQGIFYILFLQCFGWYNRHYNYQTKNQENWFVERTMNKLYKLEGFLHALLIKLK